MDPSLDSFHLQKIYLPVSYQLSFTLLFNLFICWVSRIREITQYIILEVVYMSINRRKDEQSVVLVQNGEPPYYKEKSVSFVEKG